MKAFWKRHNSRRENKFSPDWCCSQEAFSVEIGFERESEERLKTVMRKVGFAIWQIQELEDVAPFYLVTRVKAHKGIGVERGNELLCKAQSQTFGTLL